MDTIDKEIRILELVDLIAGECTSEQFLAYCDEYDNLLSSLEELENANHAPHLYQVTGGKDHFVFYDYEINEILIDGERISLIHCYYPIKG